MKLFRKKKVGTLVSWESQGLLTYDDFKVWAAQQGWILLEQGEWKRPDYPPNGMRMGYLLPNGTCSYITVSESVSLKS